MQGVFGHRDGISATKEGDAKLLEGEKAQIDTTKYYTAIAGAFLIVSGTVMYEDAMEKSGGKNSGVIGMSLVAVGWVLFLITQAKGALWARGIGVPVLTLLTQGYVMWYVLKMPYEDRNGIWVIGGAFFLWAALLGLWAFYAHSMTLDPDTGEVSHHRAGPIWTGWSLVVIGTAGYYLVRSQNLDRISGGVLPSVRIHSTVFNVFVAMLAFGWALLASGNAVEDADADADDEVDLDVDYGYK